MANDDMTWAKADPGDVPPEIDTTRPSVARVYDAILGGKDNFAVDRVVAEAAVRAMGDAGNGARLNRAALGRAVRYMVSHGVTQFLDLGSGLPTVQNTHQIAQAVDPGARVVYVDNDPSVYLHVQALLADDASTVVVLADIRTPGKLLAMEEGSSDIETVNAVFRAVHSIKGGAGAFKLHHLVRFAHCFEPLRTNEFSPLGFDIREVAAAFGKFCAPDLGQ